MGLAKRELERQEMYYSIAYKALKEIEAIEECVFHSDFYYSKNKFDNSLIYALATDYIKKYYKEIDDMKLFHSNIKEIMDYAGEDSLRCPFCEKMNEE